jgi:HAD superfamily hydrolase (TIGR01484 family)
MMEPLARMEASTCRDVRAVFSDLDDTLTLDGRLPARAYEALWRLHGAGIALVVVTGRPVGWADLIMRLWPVAGVVGENGACIFSLDGKGRAVRWYAQDDEARESNRLALAGVGREILQMVPGLRLASDQPFRETDLAIDICEDVAGLDEATLSQVEGFLTMRGLEYKISSIHLNAWFGSYDKASTCRRFISDVLGEEAGTEAHLFVGDSPNDAPLFHAFPLSVGVRNIERYAADLDHPPRFVTPSRGGDGFVELVDHVLTSRAS